MDSKQVIREIADQNITYVIKNGYARAGHNGPYNNHDTPVRNSAHWIITYSWLWKTTGEEKYCEAICVLALYLLRVENYGSAGSIICRTDRRFDSTNGLIGQAWVIEGLLRAAEMLLDTSFMEVVAATNAIKGNLSAEILIQKALALFKVQKFDKKSSSWNITDCDGSIDFDQTYNHQLWFAAAGAMLLEKVNDAEIDKEIRAFLKASDEGLFQVSDSGLIVHGLNRKLTDGEIEYRKKLNVRRKMADVRKNLFVVVKRKLDRKRSEYPFTYKLEEGYHLFDLYGFALLKKRYGDMPIFRSEKLQRAIRYALHSNLVEELSERTGDYAYNKFAYGYNSPAFEYPFVASVFGEDISEEEIKAEKLFDEQCRLTYDENAKLFLHSPDPVTLDARVYELIRFFEMEGRFNENVQQSNRTEKESAFPNNTGSGDNGSSRKKKVCFMTESIADLGGRQRITATLTSALAECPDLDISLLCTACKEKAENRAYPLSDNVHVLIDDDISGNRRQYLLYKVVRYLNKKVYHIGNVWYLKRIYFPKREVRKYKNFFSENRFDVIVGIGMRQAAMLAMCFDEKDKGNAYSMELRTSKLHGTITPGMRPKLVAWYHNPWNVYFHTHGIFQWRQEELYKFLLPKLDIHIVLTKGERERYASELGSVHVEHIYNPLTFRSEQKSYLSGNKLLFVGRLDYDLKGLDYLAEILGKVKENVPDVELTVVGDGPGRGCFETQIKSMNLDRCVQMIGASSDVQKYYMESSVCLVTSRQEGFGLVVTEAMECGLPVVSFMTEGPSEIIEDGLNGYLIEKFDTTAFADKITALCLDQKKRIMMGICAKKRAQFFSVKAIKKEWLSLLR